MVKAELIKRSPLRILERSTNGGVNAGNLGLIVSARGVGKTACLVHIATDQLLLGKSVIHISFSNRVDHILNWYETIFDEIAKNKNLESAFEIRDELLKKRVIMTFKQEDTELERLKKNIETLVREGNFNAQTLVIDGYDFSTGTPHFVAELKNFARDMKLGIWMTADIPAEQVREDGIPTAIAPFASTMCIIISLENNDEYIDLKLLKDYEGSVEEGMSLRLDPKTMLISESTEVD